MAGKTRVHELAKELGVAPKLIIDQLHGMGYKEQSSASAIDDAPPPRPFSTHRDDVAVWLFTSGSTGKSKAAIHTHRDFAFNTEVYAKRTVGYRRGYITVSVPRLYFGYATGTNLWFPFAVGATVGLFSERPTPETLSAAIARYRPTVVTNVPTMTGGYGRDAVRRFYDTWFVGHLPDDWTVKLLSRTESKDQVVDEVIISFTHDRPMECFLPGIAPTGRKVTIPLVVVVGVKDGKVAHEHIYWDQASLLVQIGLLDKSKLPVTGAEQAARLLDPTLPSNTLIAKS